jgi:Domain of unknown function (DUF4349)
MSEASFESALQELRESAPPAPERLRELVQTLPAAKGRRPVRLRPALVAVAAIAIAVGLGAAAIGGLTNSRKREISQGAIALERVPLAKRARAQAFGPQVVPTPGLTAKSRLQRQDVAMRLRVRDLSGATQSAVRTTRRLGGYVAGADYSTSSDTGNSRLALRVPVTNLQKAIARFTELGTILSQHISVADLQGGLDSLDARIARKQRRIETLHGARREREQRALARLLRSRQALIREGTYARITLQLTTGKPATKHVEPGRFGRFWVNAGDILGKEAIAVLYALVVVGPFVLLAALVLLAERARRRRSDHRLLEETG